MSFLDRVLGRQSPTADTAPESAYRVSVLSGRDLLEVVGESFYQDNLWSLVGGHTLERVRHPIVAVLEPEPENPHDRNAIKVLIENRQVGHLSREDAITYLPGVDHLQASHGTLIGLNGQIVGGGEREGRLGLLGVFLDHEPADFGIRRHQFTASGELRTGLHQAIATDLEDNSYDLSWLDQLSGAHSAADVVALRKLLAAERDPIDRHFMWAELSKCLYKCRDAFASALDEFDATCIQHDREMDVIRPALAEKFGAIPIIEMYRQAAIRCQKAREWNGMRFWAERGLVIYGTDAARGEAVEDLQKRLAQAEGKLATPQRSQKQHAAIANPGERQLETLQCAACGSSFERARTRGRKPHSCPSCRGVKPGSVVAG